MSSASYTQLRILITDDQADSTLVLSSCLHTQNWEVVSVCTLDEALIQTARQAFDLIFLNLNVQSRSQDKSGFIPQLLAENPWTRIIVITDHASIETAVQAIHRGASDYLPNPFTPAQLLHVIRTVTQRRQLERKVAALTAEFTERDSEGELSGTDPAIQAALRLARRVANSQANLLITGEIGTGRGRLARAIHSWSDRAAGPRATVTCRADAIDDLETELFSTNGKVDCCDAGTLIINQIHQLPMTLQPRLLRLMKDHEFERNDQTARRTSHVRIIATTSIDLQQAVHQGLFRADLLLALNVVRIDLPSLRNRPLDLPMLANCYLALFSKINHRSIRGFTDEAMYTMSRHTWPGNTRELRNLIERAVLLCRTDCIGVEHLPPNLLSTNQLSVDSAVEIGDLIPLATVEELHIRRVVATARSMRQAARILGIDAGTVVRRMKRYAEPTEPGNTQA